MRRKFSEKGRVVGSYPVRKGGRHDRGLDEGVLFIHAGIFRHIAVQHDCFH